MNKKIHIELGLDLYTKLFRNFSRSCHHSATNTSATKYPKPNIPLRIKRGPTDILKALATTVKHDPTAPSYKFHDDPYLYPLSAGEKRAFSLSKESGRKAAQWIRDNHAKYFNHQPDDPIIKEFLPKVQFEEDSELNENDVLNSIQNLQVSEAINLYKLCQSENIELCAETLQSLLELVSFYNCEDDIDEEWVEERRNQFALNKLQSVKTWKDGGLAEELFEGLKTNGVKPYCAIIKGMCNFSKINRAWQLYQESRNKNLILDTETYNALLRVTPVLKEKHEFGWELIKEILTTMVELKVPPNLGTMNAVLESLSDMRSWREAKSLSLQTLSEFKQFGVECSLASYYFLVKTFYTLNNLSSPILSIILEEIENKMFTIQDLKDTMFFFEAMKVCNRDLQSFETANRLNNFLLNGANYKLLGENIKENHYHQNFFVVAINSLLLDEFMEIYNYYVPHIYSPDKTVMREILKCMGLQDDLRHLPRIWSDCIMLTVARNEELMEMTLMIINKHLLEDVDPTFASQLVNVAWDIWTRVQSQGPESRFKVEWTGQMLADCISSLVRCGDVEKASQIISEVYENRSLVIGTIPLETLKVLFSAALKQKLFDACLLVVKYAKIEYPEEDEMAKQLSEVSS